MKKALLVAACLALPSLAQASLSNGVTCNGEALSFIETITTLIQCNGSISIDDDILLKADESLTITALDSLYIGHATLVAPNIVLNADQINLSSWSAFFSGQQNVFPNVSLQTPLSTSRLEDTYSLHAVNDSVFGVVGNMSPLGLTLTSINYVPIVATIASSQNLSVFEPSADPVVVVPEPQPWLLMSLGLTTFILKRRTFR